MKIFALFVFLLSTTFAHANCSAILGEDHKLSVSSFQFDNLYFPYQIRSWKLSGKNKDFKEKIENGRASFDLFFSQLANGNEMSATYRSEDPKKMETWIALSLPKLSNLDRILQLASQLERDINSPVERFIYVLLGTPSLEKSYILRVAPLAIRQGKDLGISKHLSLAEGKPVLAAGELTIEGTDPNRRLSFDLKSGTYMKGASQAQQFQVCQALEQYFQTWLGKSWQSVFNVQSIKDISDSKAQGN